MLSDRLLLLPRSFYFSFKRFIEIVCVISLSELFFTLQQLNGCLSPVILDFWCLRTTFISWTGEKINTECALKKRIENK